MKHAFRLRRSNEFTRVRKLGRSFPHPLLVLVAYANPEGSVRVGIIAGRAVGTAVVRNRAKRQLRAAVDRLMPSIKPGWDLIFIARSPIKDSAFDEILVGMQAVLQRARLLQQESANLND